MDREIANTRGLKKDFHGDGVFLTAFLVGKKESDRGERREKRRHENGMSEQGGGGWAPMFGFG